VIAGVVSYMLLCWGYHRLLVAPEQCLILRFDGTAILLQNESSQENDDRCTGNQNIFALNVMSPCAFSTMYRK
jgi:hypothetical protein